jgi:hypothetical protein
VIQILQYPTQVKLDFQFRVYHFRVFNFENNQKHLILDLTLSSTIFEQCKVSRKVARLIPIGCILLYPDYLRYKSMTCRFFSLLQIIGCCFILQLTLQTCSCNRIIILAGFSKVATIQIQGFLKHSFSQLSEKEFCTIADDVTLKHKDIWDQLPLSIIKNKPISPDIILNIENCTTYGKDIILVSEHYSLLNSTQLKILKEVFQGGVTFKIIFYYREWLSRLTSLYFDELISLETNLFPFSKYTSYHHQELVPELTAIDSSSSSKKIIKHEENNSIRKYNLILVLSAYQSEFGSNALSIYSYDSLLLSGKLILSHFYCEVLNVFCSRFKLHSSHSDSLNTTQSNSTSISLSLNDNETSMSQQDAQRNNVHIQNIISNSLTIPIPSTISSHHNNTTTTPHHHHAHHQQHSYHMLFISPLNMILLEFIFRLHNFIRMRGETICLLNFERIQQLIVYYQQHSEGVFVHYEQPSNTTTTVNALVGKNAVRNSKKKGTSAATTSSSSSAAPIYSFLIPVKLFNPFSLEKISETYDSLLRKQFSKNMIAFESKFTETVRKSVKIIEIDDELFLSNSTWIKYLSKEYERLVKIGWICKSKE